MTLESTQVRGACPHDCPDTCALVTTVRGRRRRQGAGRPGPPVHRRRAVHQGVALPRAHLPPRAPAAAAAARRPQGRGPVRAVSWDEALDEIAARLKAIARARPAGDPAVQLRRHDGPGAGRVDGPRFFHRLGASLLDRTICSTAGGDGLKLYSGRQGRHGGRVLRRGEADPHLGQQLDRHQPALLAPSRRRPSAHGARLVVHRSAPHRDGGEVRRAHRAAAGHRRRAGARR